MGWDAARRRHATAKHSAPATGASTYSQRSARSPATSAGPALRAGFRLVPVHGPACQMRTAITGQMASGVRRARRSCETKTTIVPTRSPVIPASSPRASGTLTAGCVTPPPTEGRRFAPGEPEERRAREGTAELRGQVPRDVLATDEAERAEGQRDRRVEVSA